MSPEGVRLSPLGGNGDVGKVSPKIDSLVQSKNALLAKNAVDSRGAAIK